ncbi:MAG: insulinase family protein, partial [Desulfovibrio sp.]
MPPAQQPQTSVFRLKNGLTVLVHPDKRFPLAALRLYARVGSAVEEPAKAGISHVLEHMVFKGTKKRSSGRVASDIEAVGGYLNAATSFDYTVFITELPAEHIELGMDVLQDMAFGAVFRAKDLDLEQKVVLAELERNEDNPSTRLFNRLQESVWRDSGYARPIIGFRDTVANLTTKDLRRFRQHFYQPQSMLLVVCGKVSPTTVSRLANKYFSGLENSRVWQRPPLPAPVTCPPDHNPVLVEYGPWNKAYLGLAVNLPPSGSSDIPGCEVLAQLLGGDRTSLLFRKYKYKEQLVDSIHSSSVTLERRSMLLVQATLNPANLTQVWLSLTKDLAELNADQFTDQDIARAKLNLEDAMFRSKETLSGLASKLGYFQFFESSPEAEQSYLLDLARFHRESLKNLLAKYLRIDMAKAVLLLPETFRKQAGPDLAEDMAEELACQD